MNTFLKVVITLIMATVLCSIVYGIYKAANGNYFANAGIFPSIITLLLAVLLFYGICRAIKHLWTSLSFVLIIFIMQSCSYAKSNQQVLVSSDCGMTWKKIAAGDAVPTGATNPCYMKVVIPNYPMQGDSRFITNMKDKVRAFVHIDYDYQITEPLSFIRQAKYLGRANADVDSEGALNPEQFEGAENMVIDKRIREVAKELFANEDIVELEQSELEIVLQERANKILEPLGVKLNFITLTFDLDTQTRQAIDVSTAIKIYESKGLGQLGQQIMVARAGAPNITLSNAGNDASKPVKEEENK